MRRVVWSLCIAASIVSSATLLGSQRFPLPVVARDTRRAPTVFTRPQLIVLGSVQDKCLTEETGIDGAHLTPPLIHRRIVVWVDAALRVNERLRFQPDFAERRISVNMDGTDLDLEFARSYVLMVNYAPIVPGMPWAQPLLPPPYVLASKDAGFEVIGGARVRVLRDGGELAIYDGKSYEELETAIQRGR